LKYSTYIKKKRGERRGKKTFFPLAWLLVRHARIVPAWLLVRHARIVPSWLLADMPG